MDKNFHGLNKKGVNIGCVKYRTRPNPETKDGSYLPIN